MSIPPRITDVRKWQYDKVKQEIQWIEKVLNGTVTELWEKYDGICIQWSVPIIPSRENMIINVLKYELESRGYKLIITDKNAITVVWNTHWNRLYILSMNSFDEIKSYAEDVPHLYEILRNVRS